MDKHTAGWEAAALKAEAQRDAAIDERDALRAENERMRAACKAVVGVFEGQEDIPLYAMKCRAVLAGGGK